MESQTIMKLPEGYDFATQVLGDPWDMEEFTDISVGLNNGGQAIHLDQVRVENGVFKSISVTDDSQFSPLWPMFYIGKVGDQYPVSSETYHCLFVALKVKAEGTNTHNIQSFWFENEQLNNGKFGYTKFVSFLNDQWILIKLDLESDYLGGGSKWNDLTKWKGIRIDPTDKKNAIIEVDWVRLTNCTPVNAKFNISTDNSVDFYLKRESREIFIGNFIPENHIIDVDFQGIEPGKYAYLIRNEQGATLRTGEIEINRAPLVKINKPSPQTGPSIIWEMNSQGDILRADCINNVSFTEGELVFDTQSHVCDSGGVADPKIFLNVSQPFISSSYRYLSYRLYTEWSKPWANVPGGMIVRWIWSTQGTSQRIGYRCHWVSQDLPFDVGWQIYTVDLFDPFLGSPEQKAGECPPNKNWNEAGEILELRFDPNENISGEIIRQKIDWIRLSGVEKHKSGLVYPVYFSVIDENIDGVSHNFFYTKDLSQPFQNIAKEKQVSFPPPGRDGFSIYLPVVLNNATGNNVYLWDTNGVSAGIYYICVKSIDEQRNQTISCSNAPIEIIP